MKVRAKLSTTFSLAAVFLLVVDIAAVIVVDRLNKILDETSRYNLQAGQVADAIRADRLTPQRTAEQRARLEDLERWARTEEERALIANARQAVNTGKSVEQLENLGVLYRQATATAYGRLLTIHHWTIIGLVVIMVDSILLFVILTWLVRRWLLMPLEYMNTGVTAMARGDLQRKVSQIGDEEFVAIIDNINKLGLELQTLRESAEQNQRLATVGEACGHVTHNVRSLLGSIRSLAQYESNATDVDPDSRVGFNYIIALVHKLDGWVRDLHSTLSPLKPCLAAHHLEPIVHDAIALLEPKLSEKNIQVDYHADEDLPRVLVDRGLFEQAFLAVLNNAIQAAPTDSHLGVSLKNGAPDQVTVVIEDTGPGMSDEIRQRAFDAYFTTKSESSGLGLTIAKSIVKHHGGAIEIETAPAKGTRVAMRFPVAKAN